MTAKLHCQKDDVLEDRGIRHGFYGRSGGVSAHIYASLNCGIGSKDTPENVLKNRARILQDLSMADAPLLTLSQIHSAKCIIVDAPFQESEPVPEADALVTKTPGMVLGICTADCAPVLYHGVARSGEHVIGAAHSGSMGALKGINESVIDAMCLLGCQADNIRAVVGPCIGPESYEVGSDMRAKFTHDQIENEIFFSLSKDKAEHYMFNLPDFVEKRIKNRNVKDVSFDLCQDTYKEEDYYFSYRRSVHRSEHDYGRQLSVIAIPK